MQKQLAGMQFWGEGGTDREAVNSVHTGEALSWLPNPAHRLEFGTHCHKQTMGNKHHPSVLLLGSIPVILLA